MAEERRSARQPRTRSAHPGRGGIPSGDRLLVIAPHLLLYVGKHGDTTEREIGGLTIYFPHGHSLERMGEDGVWATVPHVVIPPGQPHRIATRDLIRVLIVETESIDAAAVLAKLEGEDGAKVLAGIDRRIGALIELMATSGGVADLSGDALEHLLFNDPLPRRTLDARIRAIVDRICAHPEENHSAEEFADAVALSCSRFIHLFNREVGITFRRFKLWKRARHFLGYVTRPANLTDLALNIGYPDASHFSHSIRRVYGLKPRDIFAGSRKIRLYK